MCLWPGSQQEEGSQPEEGTQPAEESSADPEFLNFSCRNLDNLVDLTRADVKRGEQGAAKGLERSP